MKRHRITFPILCFYIVFGGLSLAFGETPMESTDMTISDGTTVSMEYTLKLDTQELIETNVGEEPLRFTQGSHQIITGLENAVEGMKVGDTKQVTVQPKDGYGESDTRLVQEIPIEKIPEDLRKVGLSLFSRGPGGREYRSVVKEVKEKFVVLDFNHPLAGKTLVFDVKILDLHSRDTQ